MNEEVKEAVLNTEEKCVPRKPQRKNTGSQTDEDCVSGHCCDASASLFITINGSIIFKNTTTLYRAPLSRG